MSPLVDVDAYVAAHRPEWDRLEGLLRRPGRLAGADLDLLVDLYQRTATHLSVVRTSSPDPQLVARLTSLVARARGVVGGRRTVGWRAVAAFATRTFPAAAYRARWWWLGVTVVTLVIAVASAAWISTHADIQAKLLTPDKVAALRTEFVTYYTEHPHSSFAAQVWTNNAYVAAQSLAFGLLLGLPTLYFMVSTGFQVGVPAGYLVAEGHTGQFFAYILPHGMLELTAVFLAMGAGLRLGWTVVDPGGRSRVRALAEEGRITFALAVGLTVVLFVSGLVEGFVTPSTVLAPLVKIAIGAVPEIAFVGYVVVLGRRAVRAGLTGDVAVDLQGSYAPEV